MIKLDDRHLIHPRPHRWKEDVIRAIFEEATAQAILSITLPPIPQPDVPRWILNAKGTYSVKEAYLSAKEHRFFRLRP